MGFALKRVARKMLDVYEEHYCFKNWKSADDLLNGYLAL